VIHSILITNGSKQKRKEEAFSLAQKILKKEINNHPDFSKFESSDSLKITQVRQLQKNLALKPYQADYKVALIKEAEKLTLPAQHALLKTLEEPPANSIIILTAQNKELLLPTIISRCQIIKLKDNENANNQIDGKDKDVLFEQINNLIKASIGQRLLMAEKISKNKDETIEFCQKQLLAWRLIMLQENSFSRKKIAENLHLIQQALTLLKTNTNHKLVLENLLISYSI